MAGQFTAAASPETRIAAHEKQLSFFMNLLNRAPQDFFFGAGGVGVGAGALRIVRGFDGSIAIYCAAKAHASPPLSAPLPSLPASFRPFTSCSRCRWRAFLAFLFAFAFWFSFVLLGRERRMRAHEQSVISM